MSKKSAERIKIEKLLAAYEADMRQANEDVRKAVSLRDTLAAQHKMLAGLLDAKPPPAKKHKSLTGSLN
jgi:hypothetical protein